MHTVDRKLAFLDQGLEIIFRAREQCAEFTILP